MQPAEAQQIADAWQQARASGSTTEALAARLSTNPATLYKWRRRAEKALGITLPTMVGSPAVAARERMRAFREGALPPLPVPNCRQSEVSADVSEQVNPEPIVAQRVANEPSVPNRGTSEPNLGPATAAQGATRAAHRKHYIIPDLQLRPGVPMDHLPWIGADIVRRKPDVVVLIGDAWDMHSLSSHDEPGSLAKEGARYEDDIKAGMDGLELMMRPVMDEIARTDWRPRMVYTEGNHENRIMRAINADPRYAGTIGPHHCNVEKYGFERHNFLEVVTVDGIAYCLAPEHRVLKRDLTWVPLGDLVVGDELLAFDEHSPGPRKGRQYRTAVVEAAKVEPAPRKRVIASDGSELVVTPEHKWLARAASTTGWMWVATTDLQPGMELCKPFEVWEKEDTHAAGWLGGIFDGEGHLSKPNCEQGGIQIGFAQNRGIVLDRACGIMRALGHEFNVHGSAPAVQQARICGASAEKLRLLGRIRPERLIAKFRPEMLGRVQASTHKQCPTILRVEDADFGDVAKIQTSTGTLIVEGFAHHNCHYFQMAGSNRPIGGSMDNRLNKICGSFVQGHEQGLLQHRRPLPIGRTIHGIVCGSAYLHSEDYRGPQRNNEWRGTVVLHDVRNMGDCDPMPLTLQYMAREYGGVELHDLLATKYPNIPRGWAA